MKKKFYAKEFMGQTKRDVLNCFLMNKYKYLLIATAFFLFCVAFENGYDPMVKLGFINSKASFGDIIFYVYRGMRVYIPMPGTKFEIPISWLACQVFIAYLIGDYANRDMTTYGQQYIIRSTRKSYWLAGKMIYCTLCVFVFYIVGYLTVLLYSFFGKEVSTAVHSDISAGVSGINSDMLTKSDVFLGIVVLPILTSIVLAVLQMILSLWMKPIYSMICVVAYVCASAYYPSYFLIGNYSMLFRSKKVIDADFAIDAEGIIPMVAIAVDCVLLIALYLIGVWKIKRFDYIEKS